MRVGNTQYPDPAAHGRGRPSDPQCTGAGISRRCASVAAIGADAQKSRSCCRRSFRRSRGEKADERACVSARQTSRCERHSVQVIDTRLLRRALSEPLVTSYISPSTMPLFNPSDKRTVHFMGIGGAGMSALALIACRRGVLVSGCDTDRSGSADLVALGARVFEGHDPAHLAGVRAVVVTAAVRSDHPELARARELGLPIIPRKVALAELIAGARSVAVSGTHGKTTTK